MYRTGDRIPAGPGAAGSGPAGPRREVRSGGSNVPPKRVVRPVRRPDPATGGAASPRTHRTAGRCPVSAEPDAGRASWWSPTELGDLSVTSGEPSSSGGPARGGSPDSSSSCAVRPVSRSISLGAVRVGRACSRPGRSATGLGTGSASTARPHASPHRGAPNCAVAHSPVDESGGQGPPGVSHREMRARVAGAQGGLAGRIRRARAPSAGAALPGAGPRRSSTSRAARRRRSRRGPPRARAAAPPGRAPGRAQRTPPSR